MIHPPQPAIALIERAEDLDMPMTYCSTCQIDYQYQRGYRGKIRREEDGAPMLSTRTYICPICRISLCDHCRDENLATVCEDCGKVVCTEHRVMVDGMEVCSACAGRDKESNAASAA